MAIERIDFYIGMIISGVCGGIGSAFGAYLVNKHIVERIESLRKKISKIEK